MYPIDLHVHSTVSDGTFTPKELAFYGKSKGLVAMALTDHDTTDGIEECRKYADTVHLRIIDGIEISSTYKGIEVHILGYFIDIKNEKLQTTLKEVKDARSNRNVDMINKLNELGLAITYEDVITSGDKDAVITRAHFGRALINKGYVETMDEAFDKYLGRNKPAYIERKYIDYKDCIDLIHQAGGLAVIAHPKLYKLKEVTLETFIADLAVAGIDGIETVYPEYPLDYQAKLTQLCQQHNLVPTGGSDFHGANKPHLDIAFGFGDTYVPINVLEEMEEYLNNKYEQGEKL